MKLISVFQTLEAADDLRQRLERSGIAVIVESPVSVRPSVPTRHLVFAAIAEQHADAVRLLDDPEYKVQHPVDPADFAAHGRDSSARQVAHQTINRALFWILLVLILGAALVALLVTY
ncbi:MAG: hypothetical protein MUE35_10370 [Hydrogenophaga sp.]|jgi:hypothetical protein|nr:hypothetical protein [Hydrogenophaga sp.]